jgi:mono/diheme cytochrome c family protein
MKKGKAIPRWGLILVALACGLTAGCDYARMTSDEAHDTYEAHFPVMPPDSVSVTGGTTALRLADPNTLENPWKADGRTIAAGRKSYADFCVHCHGVRGDGRATVGQSFAPLPTDLRSEAVQAHSDGELFYRIGFGFQRHPPLIHSMMEEDIWAVIVLMREMVKKDQ